MPSLISWLDYSELDRQSAIHIIEMFREHDTRDELGVGSVRDALSDLLFPGISTIQTRPRYFLLVPWVYQMVEDWASSKHRSREEIAREARRRELELLRALAKADDTSGVIGIEAGDSLKRLPSSVYWQGLLKWGIRRFPGSLGQFHRVLRHGQTGRLFAEVDGDDRYIDGDGYWHGGLPPVPKYFPQNQSLNLSADEAAYLLDRIRGRAGDTLLAWIVENTSPFDEADAPWRHPRVVDLSLELSGQLTHGRWFSELMHGAALLYNLMLARKRGGAELVDYYEDLIETWGALVKVERPALALWDRQDFWKTVFDVNPRITVGTRVFVDSWMNFALGALKPVDLGSSSEAQRLIFDREVRLKRSRSRLHDARALERWSGSSGTGLMTFRWPVVQNIVRDIRTALDGDPSHA